MNLVTQAVSHRMHHVMAAKDARIDFIRQVLKQAKQLKLAALENIYRKKVWDHREEELNRTRLVALSNALMVFFSYLLSPVLTFTTLGTYIFLGGVLDSSLVFSTLAFFFNINRAMAAFPSTMMLYQASRISLQRLQQFLRDSCITEDANEHKTDAVIREETYNTTVGVSMVNCSFAFPGDVSTTVAKPLLSHCSLTAQPGQLVVINGSVGSGKTTLISSLIGFNRPRTGVLEVSGSKAYVSQKPFLINGTVRENILFGLPFDAERYRQAVDAVCLWEDLRRLPAGDETVLRGTGITLSGGQQSRVTLARAVYSRSHIIVLDDPLAAIDPKVSSSLIDGVLGPRGVLRDSIRIVTSSSEELMRLADVGYAIADGTICELKRPQPGGRKVTFSTHTTTPKPDAVVAGPTYQGTRSQATSSGYGTVQTSGSQAATAHLEDEEAALLPASDAYSESIRRPVPLSTYREFLGRSKKGGWLLVLGLASCSKILDVVGIYYLKLSSEAPDMRGHFLKLLYFLICDFMGAALSGLFVVVAYYACLIPASRSIHADLTAAVVSSGLWFFDETPMGEILSRFTNDMNKTDSKVSGGLISMTAILVSTSASILVITSSSIFTLLYLIPLGFIYSGIQSYYINASRQLRRVENETRVSILNVSGEILAGAAVIDAFGQSANFKERARQAIDKHTRVWAPFLALDTWLFVRLQALSW